MLPSSRSVGTLDPLGAAHRGRVLMYGFVTSIIGLPIGIALGLPIVWGLALCGIVGGGMKLYLRRVGT